MLCVCILYTFKSSAEELRFTILHTTDEHSHLLPAPVTDYKAGVSNPAVGGFARLATAISQIRNSKMEENESVLLFSSGDVMGGTPFAWLILKGYAAELELMKYIGYDAMTIGNHEFDYGPDVLAEYFKKAGFEQKQDFAILSSNILIPEGHSLNDIYIEENRIFELENGLKVGAFGLLGEAALALAPYAEPVDFFYSITSAKEQVKKLQELGAEVIVAITHSGIAEDRILAEKVDGLNLILGGHDHIKTKEPELINGTYVFHPSYYLSYLGKLELAFDRETRTIRLLNEENDTPFLISLDDSIEEDTIVKNIVAQYVESLNNFLAIYTDSMFFDIQSTVVRTDFPLLKSPVFEESTVGNFLTDAMRLVTEELTGEKVHFAFQGNGVIRADLIPGKMPWSKNQVSFFDVVNVAGLGSGPDMQPGYPLVSVYLTEKEIFNVLEVTAMLSQIYGNIFFLQFSGLRYTYDPGRAFWLRNIPVLNLPLPANKAVLSAEKFTGTGIQDHERYKKLDKNSDRLYHVVSDYYITSFLPMVGDLLPHLTIELKDKNGNQISVDEAILIHDGRELKVWDVLVRYAHRFKEEGIPDYYRQAQGRITVQEGTPLYVWTITGIVLFFLTLILIVYGLFRIIRRRRN